MVKVTIANSEGIFDEIVIDPKTLRATDDSGDPVSVMGTTPQIGAATLLEIVQEACTADES